MASRHSLSNNHQHLLECHNINEVRHLILLKELTIVHLNEACDIIIEQKELQTQRRQTILFMNGCPDPVIEKTIVRKLKDFTSPTSHTVKKCTVYLHLPWLGTPWVRHESKIKASVEKCFFAEEQRVIFTFRPLVPAIKRMCCLLRF